MLELKSHTSEKIEIFCERIVPTNHSLAGHDGQKIYDQIAAAFNQDRRVILSFRNLERLTWSVVFTAIAQLYENFPEEKIEKTLKFVDIRQDDLDLIKRVVEVKKDYLKDPTAPVKTLSEEGIEKMKKENPDNPWIQNAGMFKDDPQFDDMLAYIEAYNRELDAEMAAYYDSLDEENEVI
ncbi:MAG: STAS-like domain-containing protein [Hormoscilla sp. GM102CHS1]|nr:STAS-like domain-containing protein [Hormoscilla sp. GM102CHS1]